MSDYFDKLSTAKDHVVRELKGRKIEERYLKFGGPGVIPSRITVPTDARSEFLANRAMGDWAEQLLAAAIDNTLLGYKTVHYGDSDRMAAGEPGFKEFYKSRVEGVCLHGKRPDLLVVPKSYDGPKDVSGLPTEDLRDLVATSLVAAEVRSSKFEALHYAQARKDLKALGKSGRDTQSFTVKVEDLRIVYRWIENFQKTQIYCQVFFDSMFAINFLDIFEIIGSGSGFTIETPEKSQEKSTIFIPISHGKQIASYTSKPTFEVEHRRTQLGRHDAFVRPVGGDVQFDPNAFMQVVAGQTAPQTRLF